MLDIKYIPEEDCFVMNINGEVEQVDARDLFNMLGVEESRLHYLLSLIHENRKKRLTEMTGFMDYIKSVVVKQAKIEDKMEEAVDESNEKKMKMLKILFDATLKRKNTAKELRYAIKNLEIEEGRLKAKLLELSV